MAKFEASIFREWDFMTVWIITICMEKVVEEQGIAHQQQIQTVV